MSKKNIFDQSIPEDIQQELLAEQHGKIVHAGSKQEELDEYLFEMPIKLVGSRTKGKLWLVDAHSDWVHDHLGDTQIFFGIIYTDGEEPFHRSSTSITGYFQCADTGKWIYVQNGSASYNHENPESNWKYRLEDFPEIQSALELIEQEQEKM